MSVLFFIYIFVWYMSCWIDFDYVGQKLKHSQFLSAVFYQLIAWYSKTPKHLYTQKIAVIILKLE